jgi:hypothetical protein
MGYLPMAALLDLSALALPVDVKVLGHDPGSTESLTVLRSFTIVSTIEVVPLLYHTRVILTIGGLDFVVDRIDYQQSYRAAIFAFPRSALATSSGDDLVSHWLLLFHGITPYPSHIGH